MVQNIRFGNINQLISTELEKNHYSSYVILMDRNTFQHCLPLISVLNEWENVFPIGVEPGELSKSISTATYIWTEMQSYGIDRNSLLINLGGGVICDIGGFCASTYMRGIDFIHVPTTLLAQVDAAIGGKTGVDINNIKNMVGVINQPKSILIDNLFLKTLNQREVLSGFAEMIKHGLLDCFGHLRELFKINIFEEMPTLNTIKMSAQVKEIIVGRDPKERNIRKTLNLGHTLGHAVESFFIKNKESITHGEAIVCGIICAMYISQKKLEFPEQQSTYIIENLERRYPYLEFECDDIDEIVALTKHDKKAEGGIVKFVLMKEIGRIVYDVEVSKELMAESLKYYLSLKANA